MNATDLWEDHPRNKILPFSDAEKWLVISQYVDDLLLRCSGTQLPDSSLTIFKRLEWQAYRDELRSIQDTFINPDDVIFPTEPAEE